MTKEELHQIGLAIFHAAPPYVTQMGAIVPLDAVFAILNSHCEEADISAKLEPKDIITYHYHPVEAR